MKVVILCGGRGERMGELTASVPKPMVEVGGRPLLWHIMRHYQQHGFTHFVLGLGRLGWVVEDYVRMADAGLQSSLVQVESTGWETQNGGRVKRLAPYVREKTFLLAWGDGVHDVDLGALLTFHRQRGKLCTILAVRPPSRFGRLDLADGLVLSFDERRDERAWVSGGVFVCEPGVLDYIAGDETRWEAEPTQRLIADRQLVAYRHDGFWRCMDTPRDRRMLEELWAGGKAPWKTWTD